MQQCMFMTIQLHLNHTLVECETKLLIVAWQLQATIRCRLLGQRTIVTWLSDHPNGDTQLLNLGTVCLSLTLKRPDPARQAKLSGPQPLYQIVVTEWPTCSGIIFYESSLLAASCVEYLLRGTIYEKPHGTINVLYVAFWAFVMNCENQELIWLKFHKCARFNNSKGHGIVGGKLVQPAIPCRVCFWPATRERLPTPVVEHGRARPPPPVKKHFST